ncbi:MAG: hypothetical protein NNA18_10200, partial [Nitrospira sp.]|nr:hypothetical protein [Nitrospira sp.]
MASTTEKTGALLRFLREAATLRRKRIAAYGAGDTLLWLADLPQDLPHTWKDACKSAFVADNPAEVPDLWLEVRKKRKPTLPPLPRALQDWVPQKLQNNPDEYLDKRIDELLDLLNRQITVLVEKRVRDPNGGLRDHATLVEK